MTYSILGSGAGDLAVQQGTNAEISEGLGTDVGDDDDDEVCLVLNDMGNLQALVLAGTPEDFMNLAGRILTQALAMQYPDAEHRVRLHLGAHVQWGFRLPDEYTLVLDADGRRYLGVAMSGDDLDLSVTTWDGDPDENETTHPRGNKVDGEGREYFHDDTEPLHRKCAHCHLFVEEQDPRDLADAAADGVPLARYIHSHRGDDADEALDESHEAEPEPGPGAPLTWWKLFGPAQMRSRFIDDETVDVLGEPLPRGRCDTCGSPCDALTGKCMREPEKHQVALP